MIQRELTTKLAELATCFPVVTLTGPRQSGKTYLLRHQFPHYRYVSLEDIELREFARTDPRGFLNTYADKVIIDEAQHVPTLFSYLQSRVDEVNSPGMYILAGSQNFLLSQAVGQSLAGRAAVLKLLPFSQRELRGGSILAPDVAAQIFNGGYPRVFDQHIPPVDFYQNYLETYVERDVRLLKNVTDLSRFVLFVKMCAARVGQLLNLTSLANDCSISVPTANGWLSVLEASYICYRLHPDFSNYGKRLVKTPKLYFYDTGLVCSLLGIATAQQVATHYAYGSLFENLVINQFVKRAFNAGREPDLTFWRDSAGNEVDLIDRSDPAAAHAYEIKNSQTFNPAFFKGLKRWSGLSGSSRCTVVYAGSTPLATSDGDLQPLGTLFA